MKLHIQDPADPKAPFLHEKILEICQGAARGGGAFSFASSDGVNLLMKDDVFRSFLKSGSFELVVGVDAITNKKALVTLKQAADELPSLDVKVFYHPCGACAPYAAHPADPRIKYGSYFVADVKPI